MSATRPRALALAVLAVSALTACESTQEESAQLRRTDKLHATAAAEPALSISKPSSAVEVVSTSLVRSSEADAVTVTMRNTSTHVLGNLPIEITVRGSGSQVLYTNNTPGVTGSLVAVPSILPGQELTWVDDQVQLSQAGSPAAVTALVGESEPVPQAPSSVPRMTISGVHAVEEASLGEGTAGTVANPSSIPQSALVVYGVARRGQRIVAAGRAVITQVPAGRSAPFQIFFIGEAKGAKIELTAPASTLE